MAAYTTFYELGSRTFRLFHIRGQNIPREKCAAILKYGQLPQATMTLKVLFGIGVKSINLMVNCQSLRVEYINKI